MGGALIRQRSAMSLVGHTIAPAVSIPVTLDRGHVPESSPDLLTSVFERIAPELLRFVRALGIDPHRAEDLLQDVYLATLQSSPPTVDEVSLRKWLYRVCANRCHLEHRRQARWRSVWDGLARIWSQEASPASGAEEVDLVRRAIENLAPVQRSVIVMRYFCEMNSKDIGEILELPDSTIRSHLRLARLRLAEILKDGGYEHG
jgi:RNA polymerase sigma factor (sigma-70 family)